jgi:polygalacturonase
MNKESDRAWRMADKIAKETSAPKFPKVVFSVMDFGATANRQQSNTQAFAAAILHCHKQGGGKVIIPAGEYLTGPIHLLANVNLHLEAGCTLFFSTNPNDYLPAVFTRWEGMELMGYSPLVYAFGQDNIALTGKGTLNGQADEMTWWPWKGGKTWGKEGIATQAAARKSLEQDTESNRPVSERIYTEGSQIRPSFVQFYQCNKVLIEDITITQAPFWLINPVLCNNVTVRGVTCASLGPNSDGCDPESCKNVIIENCIFDTGDDCIAIKSGRNADGRRIGVAAENIVIRNCQMRSGHGGIVIGSEISGGAHHIFAENCVMSSHDLERGLRFKTNSVRGGKITQVYFRNIDIGDVQTAIVIDFGYEEGDSGKFTPEIDHIEIRNLHCKNAKQIFNIAGYERSPIRHLHLVNVQIDHADNLGNIQHTAESSAQNVQIQGNQFSF